MASLMNSTLPVPETFFIFANEQLPITFHNLNINGKLFSAACGSFENQDFLQKYLKGTVRYLPFAPCESDLHAISPYFLTAISDYRVEYDAELYRAKHYPLFPSRLSALYAFGNLDTCKEVSRKYGWDLASVKRFRLQDSPLNRIVRVNMGHVSLARHAYKVSSIESTDTIWSAYWAGYGNMDFELPMAGFKRGVIQSGEIWEYLIEGMVHLVKDERPGR